MNINIADCDDFITSYKPKYAQKEHILSEFGAPPRGRLLIDDSIVRSNCSRSAKGINFISSNLGSMGG